MIKKKVLIIYLLSVTIMLTSTGLYAKNEKQITQSTTDKKLNGKTFIISLHHLSAANLLVIKSSLKNFYKNDSKRSLVLIANCILKFNIEFEIYNNFYLKTNFFNNVVSVYAITNETKNIKINASISSSNVTEEKINELRTNEFFSFSIGKKAFYGNGTNMFGIEFGFNIGRNREKNKHKLGIIITLIPYRKAFENGIHISTGHIIINLVSLYDIFKHNRENGEIKISFLFQILINALTLHIGYIT